MVYRTRRMTRSDLPAVLAIEQNSFPSPWSIQSFQNEISSAYAYPLVIWQVHSPRILGYLCSWIVLDECHILNLAIRQGHRRKGFATHLIECLFRICRHKSVHRYYLEVRRSNVVAISLYEKHGFRRCGFRKGYYSDTGEDGLIMQRRDYWE